MTIFHRDKYSIYPDSSDRESIPEMSQIGLVLLKLRVLAFLSELWLRKRMIIVSLLLGVGKVKNLRVAG